MTAPEAADSVWNQGSWTIDRRRFLSSVSTLVATGLAGSLVAGCSDHSGDGRTTTTTEGHAASPASRFDVARRLQELVRASPDALEHRAAEVVATGDPAAVIAFVRDSITVLPATGADADLVRATRWGARATLRAGAGTMRERADLLVELLGQCGVTATVRQANLPSHVTETLLREVRTPTFSIDGEEVAAAYALAGLEPPPTEPPSGVASPLVDAVGLLQLIPEGARRPELVSRLSAPHVPVVELSIDGTPHWAFALVADDLVSDPPDGLVEAEPAQADQVLMSVKVAVTTQAGAAGDPYRLEEVATASWDTTELAGRRVTLSFLPPDDPSQILKVPRSQIDLVAPTIVLHPGPIEPSPWAPTALPGESGTATPAPDSIVTGRLISRSAGVIRVDPATQEPVTAYGTVNVPEDDDRRAAAARAAVVTGEVIASSYPLVELALSVTDEAGSPIEGLSATDFDILDEGAPQSATVLANTKPPAPRIVVVYDTSGSVAWPTPEARHAFEASVAKAIVAASETIPLGSQVIGVGVGPPAGAWPTPDGPGLQGAMANAISSGSTIWSSLAQSVSAAPAAIVFISDFRSVEEPSSIEDAQAALAGSRVPVVCIPVGGADETTVSAVADLTNGSVLRPEDSDFENLLGARVRDAAAAAQRSTYRIRYRLLDDQAAGPATRALIVALHHNDAARLETSYRPPGEVTEHVPPGVGGVYLEIWAGARRSLRRLAGPPVSGSRLSRLPNALDVVDAQSLLEGLTTIVFEPGVPTAAAIADDLLTGYLSLEELDAASPIDSVDRFVELAQNCRRPSLLEAGVVAANLEALTGVNTNSAAHVETLTVVVITEVIRHTGDAADGNDRELRTSIDIPPELNRRVPATGDADGFAAALVDSLSLSRREGAVTGSGAAIAVLANREFAFVDRGVLEVPGLSDEENGTWRALLAATSDGYRLVPIDGGAKALWLVDPATGTCIAVDAEGRGGAAVLTGLDCFQAALDLAAVVINALVVIMCVKAVAKTPGPIGALKCNAEVIKGKLQLANLALMLLSVENLAVSPGPDGLFDFLTGTAAGVLSPVLGAAVGGATSVLQFPYDRKKCPS